LIAKYERRARFSLLFRTPWALPRLPRRPETPAGLIREEGHLFEYEPETIDFQQETENDGADEATRELLEEIDRSLHGFRAAAQTHAWLADAGLNAEEQLVTEAKQAQAEGKQAEQVDLAAFCAAILLGGGELVGTDGQFAPDPLDGPTEWMSSRL
jgi:hypothetical protein